MSRRGCRRSRSIRANLGVILRRNDDLERRHDHRIMANEFRATLGEGPW